MTAEPIPVPRVVTMMVPASSLAAPKATARLRGVGVAESGDPVKLQVLAHELGEADARPGTCRDWR